LLLLQPGNHVHSFHLYPLTLQQNTHTPNIEVQISAPWEQNIMRNLVLAAGWPC
jgi:hypothetical protein